MRKSGYGVSHTRDEKLSLSLSGPEIWEYEAIYIGCSFFKWLSHSLKENTHSTAEWKNVTASGMKSQVMKGSCNTLHQKLQWTTIPHIQLCRWTVHSRVKVEFSAWVPAYALDLGERLMAPPSSNLPSTLLSSPSCPILPKTAMWFLVPASLILYSGISINWVRDHHAPNVDNCRV